MGKRLIIKDADFSENGIYEEIINWYNNGFKYQMGAPFNAAASPGGAGLVMPNVPIDVLKLQIKSSLTSAIGETLKVYLGTKNSQYTGSETSLATHTITQDDLTNGYIIIRLSEAVTLQNSQALMIVSDGANAGVGYVISGVSESDKTTYLRTSSSSTTITENNNLYLCVQYGKTL